jgi:hypothetical protein
MRPRQSVADCFPSMRIPVFARRTNPSVDQPILRKKIGYAKAEVAAFRAAWVDPLDPRKGIICREMITSERKLQPEPDSDSGQYIGAEIPGLRFEPPKNAEHNPLLTRVLIENLFTAEKQWDWSHEAAIPA